jgi:cellulose synthase/poly-beta-1,6-N-acetylglucosamine synthase-like glycosyltransferase
MAVGCQSPLLWVSDSNTRVSKDTLKLLVAEHLNNNSKIVFSPIKGSGSGTFGSIMANSYLNLFVSGSILTGWSLFKKVIIVGKSMLIERQTLEELGGFSVFDCYLAEDYMMGEIYREHEKYISTNFTWITNYSSTTTIGTFYKRMERWAKMRIRINPFSYALEILVNPVAIAFVSIFFLGVRGAVFFAGAFALNLLVNYLSHIFINKEDCFDIRFIVMYPFAMLVKDAILFVVYFDAIFSKTVNWHGNIIKIGPKSRIESTKKEI